MKYFLLLFLIALLAGCKNSDKLKPNDPAPPPIEEEQEVVDQAREQRLDDMMSAVGNVHTPFKSELISNSWCAVIDDNLNIDLPNFNNIQFDRNDLFEVVAPIGDDGEWSTTKGAYALRGPTLYLVKDDDAGTIEETAEISLARGPDAVLLKITVWEKPSLLYRDCSIN